MLLSNSEFITQLRALLEAQSSSGSVFITQKRFTYQNPSVAATEDVSMDPSAPSTSTSTSTHSPSDTHEFPCIIKATNGRSHSGGAKKIKISTLVQPEDHPSFSLNYGTLLKTHFALTMRKKQKDKKRKAAGGVGATTGAMTGKKATASTTTTVAKTRQRTAGGLPKVVGPRRGAGHSNRQRLWRARVRAATRILEGRRRRETAAKPLFDLQPRIPAEFEA